MVVIARYIEAETGEEIIVFLKRGKPVTMVRDAITKRFIRGIKGITVAVALVFDYPPDKARRSNPLYVDIKTASFVMGKDIEKMDTIEKELAGKCKDIMSYMFGETLGNISEEKPPEHYDGVPPRDKMPIESCIGRIVGIEYISVPIDEVYPDYHFWVVWHHYKEDCQEVDGSARI